MKKWIAVLLAAAILLTAAGCGGNAEQPSETDQSHTVGDTSAVGNGTDDPTTPPPTEGEADQSSEPEDSPAPEQTQETAAEPGDTPASVVQQPSAQPEITSPPATAPITTPEPDTARILIAYFTCGQIILWSRIRMPQFKGRWITTNP